MVWFVRIDNFKCSGHATTINDNQHSLKITLAICGEHRHLNERPVFGACLIAGDVAVHLNDHSASNSDCLRTTFRSPWARVLCSHHQQYYHVRTPQITTQGMVQTLKDRVQYTQAYMITYYRNCWHSVPADLAVVDQQWPVCSRAKVQPHRHPTVVHSNICLLVLSWLACKNV